MSDQTAGTAQQHVVDQQAAPDQSTAERQQVRALRDYSQTKVTGQRSMQVKVYSPFRDYYDGQAFSLTAVNATGPFDILPKHHNFISLLNPCDLIIRTVDTGEQRIRISGGIIHVKADQVIVFLDV
ncbi:MAG: hypothetical protein WA843_03375 [Candidatus Saccharimonadales bacterium]